MNVLFVFVLVIVLVVSLTVWLILEPGRASACDNSAAYHLGYIGLGLNPVQKQITVHTEYGNLSGSYQRSPVLKHLYLTNGVYEPAVVAELEDDLREGDVFVDVGAQEGYFTLVASHCVGSRGRVFAFETDPEHVQMLRGVAERSKHQNISILEFGPMVQDRSVSSNPQSNDVFIATHNQSQNNNNTFMVRPRLVEMKQPSVWSGCPVVERHKSVWPEWLRLQKLKASASVKFDKHATQKMHTTFSNRSVRRSSQQVKVNTTELDRAIQIENETLGQHNKIRFDRVRVVVHVRDEPQELLKSIVSNMLRRLSKECTKMIFLIRMVPIRNHDVIGVLAQAGFDAESIDVYHTNGDQEWKPLDTTCNVVKYTRWSKS